jgi:hypothetical protein
VLCRSHQIGLDHRELGPATLLALTRARVDARTEGWFRRIKQVKRGQLRLPEHD